MPGVAKDIFEKAGMNTDRENNAPTFEKFSRGKIIRGSGRSEISKPKPRMRLKKSQMLLSAVISEKTKSLNAEARDSNWFKVDMSNLVILKNTQDLRINLAIAALAGIFIGTLFAFVKHYISEEN